MAGLEAAGRVRPDVRRFVNFHAEPVASAMEKACHPAVALAGLVTLLVEEFLDGLMYLFGWRAVTHFPEGELLTLEDGIVEFPHRFGGATANNGPGDV